MPSLLLNYVIMWQGDVLSEEEEEEEVISLPTDKYKPTSLEKMITLIAMLVEKSRGDDQHLKISIVDFNSVAGGKVCSLVSSLWIVLRRYLIICLHYGRTLYKSKAQYSYVLTYL